MSTRIVKSEASFSRWQLSIIYLGYTYNYNEVGDEDLKIWVLTTIGVIEKVRKSELYALKRHRFILTTDTNRWPLNHH